MLFNFKLIRIVALLNQLLSGRYDVYFYNFSDTRIKICAAHNNVD
jgi:hypothetical protein